MEYDDEFGVIWGRGEDKIKERDVFREDPDAHVGAT